MDFIFKDLSDVVWLQEYFIKKNQTTWFHETIFQNQKQYVLTIDLNDIPIEEIQSALYQFILLKKRNDWVKDILHDYFYYKEKSEQENILYIVIEMFNGERKELTNIVGEISEKEIIKYAITSLFEYHDAVSFDSLIKFRLKKYFEHLIEYVEIAIDEYKMEQEYQVFIQMLRDYLYKREPKENVVRIFFDDYVRFYNEQFLEFPKSKLAQLLDRRLLTNHPVYIDSVTIAPLLSIAPNKIYLYTDLADNGLIRTIQNIFEERVILCKREEFWLEKANFVDKKIHG